ncbi:MAG: aminodeoxychorismate synthase component I, partial [Flavobacteriaceae bacterium]|nr:aminodeoxychorismate synthase component I [Flavobacteriaceae bacterium]
MLDDALRAKLLCWAQGFDEAIWLDSNQYDQRHTSFQAILAVDAFTAIKTDSFEAFKKLHEYQQQSRDWLFGYLSYDLKNDTEELSSNNFDGLQFPELFFFQPKRMFVFSENKVELRYLNLISDEMEQDWQEILDCPVTGLPAAEGSSVRIRLRTTKDQYFNKIAEMLQHIERGDIYEANFCQEFYSEDTRIDPVKTFLHLNEISKPPFASFLRMHDLFAISASPERYLKRKGTKVISQPIKGTAKRLSDPSEDRKMVRSLEKDPKERSENIMITDLVRNDLSRFAIKGSVEVEEL